MAFLIDWVGRAGAALCNLALTGTNAIEARDPDMAPPFFSTTSGRGHLFELGELG
jgi:hypothetical protein